MWCWGVLSLNLVLDAGGSILLKTRSELLTWKQCQVHHRHYLSTPYTFTFPCLAHPDPCHLLSCEASIKDILKAHILNKNLNKPRQDKPQSHDLLIIPSFQGLFHSSRTPSEHTGKLRTRDAMQQQQGVQPTLPGPRVSGLPTMPVQFTCNVPRAKFGKLEYDSGWGGLTLLKAEKCWGLSFVRNPSYFRWPTARLSKRWQKRGVPLSSILPLTPLCPSIRSLDSNLTFRFAGSHYCLSSECWGSGQVPATGGFAAVPGEVACWDSTDRNFPASPGKLSIFFGGSLTHLEK